MGTKLWGCLDSMLHSQSVDLNAIRIFNMPRQDKQVCEQVGELFLRAKEENWAKVADEVRILSYVHQNNPLYLCWIAKVGMAALLGNKCQVQDEEAIFAEFISKVMVGEADLEFLEKMTPQKRLKFVQKILNHFSFHLAPHLQDQLFKIWRQYPALYEEVTKETHQVTLRPNPYFKMLLSCGPSFWDKLTEEERAKAREYVCDYNNHFSLALSPFFQFGNPSPELLEQVGQVYNLYRCSGGTVEIDHFYPNYTELRKATSCAKRGADSLPSTPVKARKGAEVTTA